MRKSPDAFRTISEVAQDLDLPQHVLRFWETRFSQIKPMKRGGGRRYYRPDDIDLLRGIRHLLYDEGYTIKGVQRILKEQGVRHVIDTVSDDDLSQPDAENQPAVAADIASVAPVSGPSAQSDHAEPNQLELQRPPLVAPQTPVQPVVEVAAQNSEPVPMTEFATAATMVQNAAPELQASTAVHALRQTEQTQFVPQPVPTPAQPAAPVQMAPVPSAQPAVQPHAVAAASAISQDEPEQALRQAREAVKPHVEPPTTRAAPIADAQRKKVATTALPKGLVEGEPKFVSGQSATVSVSDAQRIQQQERSQGQPGLLDRLRGASAEPQAASQPKAGMARDDIRRLQSTLFELLECKRILDQARSDD